MDATDIPSYLATLGLSASDLEERRHFLGGSDAPVILGGSAEEVNRLARVKRGEEAAPDLSGVLPVQLGRVTEALNVAWFERTTGRHAHSSQQVIVSPEVPFLRATLDGLTTSQDGREAVLECKHVNAFTSFDRVAAHYMPQLQHNLHCSGLGVAILSVFLGTLKYKFDEIERDDWYIATLIDAEKAFWASVQDGSEPRVAAPAASSQPSATRSYDMTGDNFWADSAARWIAHEGASKAFAQAVEDIKQIMPEDAKRASGHGIVVARNKRGGLRIARLEATQEAA